MMLTKLYPRQRSIKSDVLARFEMKNRTRRLSIRLNSNIINLLGILPEEKLSISFVRDNPKILFLTKGTDYKLSAANRFSIKCPFSFEEERSRIGVPYEAKDNGVYLYFDQIEDRTPVIPGILDLSKNRITNRLSTDVNIAHPNTPTDFLNT